MKKVCIYALQKSYIFKGIKIITFSLSLSKISCLNVIFSRSLIWNLLYTSSTLLYIVLWCMCIHYDARVYKDKRYLKLLHIHSIVSLFFYLQLQIILDQSIRIINSNSKLISFLDRKRYNICMQRKKLIFSFYVKFMKNVIILSQRNVYICIHERCSQSMTRFRISKRYLNIYIFELYPCIFSILIKNCYKCNMSVFNTALKVLETIS